MPEDSRTPPVVLVHGFLSTSELTRPMGMLLEERGFQVHPPTLSPLCIQDVNLLTRELASSIDEVLARTGASQVDLVGLSQGGIISLAYVKLQGGAAKVRRLVAVASPLRGTWAPVAGLLSAPLLGLVSRGFWQVLPGSGLLERLDAAPMPESVPLTTIAIDGDLISPPSRCHVRGSKQITVSGVPLIAHQWMVVSSPVADAIASTLRG